MTFAQAGIGEPRPWQYARVRKYVALALILGFLTACGSTSSARPTGRVTATGPVNLPWSLQGMTEAQATAFISSKGLVVGGTEQQTNQEWPHGEVFDVVDSSHNNVLGQTLEPGSDVTLIVSSKSTSTDKMPDAVGLIAESARSLMTGGPLTFQITIVRVQGPAALKDTVIAQDPPAGVAVRPSAAVTLTVDGGP